MAFEPFRNRIEDFLLSADRAFKSKNDKMMINVAWMMSNLMLDIDIHNCAIFDELRFITNVFDELLVLNSKVNLM